MRFIARVQIMSESGALEAPRIAVASALRHEPEIILPGEVDRRHDVRGLLRCNGIDARPRGPRIQPAARLSESDIVTDVVGVLQLSEDLEALGGLGRFATDVQRRLDLDQAPTDSPAKGVPR